MHDGLKNLDAFLSRHEKFIISTHESPDADGLGAEIALFELLIHLGKTAIILNSDVTPDKFQFIDIENEVRVINVNFEVPNDIAEYALIVIDTNDINNIGKAYIFLKDKIKEIFVVDHHEGDKTEYSSSYIRVDASSSCEIMYSIVRHYSKEISFKAAQALFAGALFDTGSFRYPKTSAATFKMAADLVERGADPFTIYNYIYESNSLASFELRTQILSTLKVFFNGSLVMMKMTGAMLLKTGAPYEEGELNINVPLTVKGVVVSVLVKEDTDGMVKVSMRSKGDYDVAAIAIANGGGGHKNAAGYKSKLKFDKAYKKAFEDVSRLFQ
ncbi:MAG TPA: bifunctional oligoribonuclease/PAP phosphatase NrnA [Spirochaetota bacterium]|nr:bifunctional oligoribonuclease/PAP phosphatase NrnA [Spirochaetota bacterium]HPJ36925.1 bifunctional oligoribonuclease/PAP phosphatase NrnA [Spirochaetota bacterium]